MKRFIDALKVTLLLGALGILAASALPGSAGAQSEIEGDCVPPGEECHFVAHGVLYHGKGKLAD